MDCLRGSGTNLLLVKQCRTTSTAKCHLYSLRTFTLILRFDNLSIKLVNFIWTLKYLIKPWWIQLHVGKYGSAVAVICARSAKSKTQAIIRVGQRQIHYTNRLLIIAFRVCAGGGYLLTRKVLFSAWVAIFLCHRETKRQ